MVTDGIGDYTLNEIPCKSCGKIITNYLVDHECDVCIKRETNMKIKKGKRYLIKESGAIILATQNSTSSTFDGVVIKGGNDTSMVGDVSAYWTTGLVREYNSKTIEHKIENKIVILELNEKQIKMFKKLTNKYPYQRFISYRDGWLDMTTGLLWEKFQDEKKYTFGQATKIKRGKYKLPTIEQLETIVDKSINKPATELPKMVADSYWSSSTYVGSVNVAWYINFSYGFSFNSYKTIFNYVRCVTLGPFGEVYKCTK